ncbi:MAG: 30S ribosomal protein S8 [Nitrospirota bacterium]|nr:30S ribosomal protein S8 [Nitrospirota bacterium]MDE3035123.1 30S ribosomal protein S8 [Nitrospirota bacterium]MDE3117970.1 30S ribosomal protein S8 [Nitrospirota bacterium]MDE3242889.1 30S ribosomal protein S8 [Nitrospirota bacterium]
MMTDPIADLLVRIQNGARRGHETVTVPASKLKGELLRVMQSEGFIAGYESATADGHPTFRVHLRYVGEGKPMITGMARVSKPGKRVYAGKRNVKPVMGGMGLSILSTSKGLLTDQEARQSSLGGEVLCNIW